LVAFAEPGEFEFLVGCHGIQGLAFLRW
jgi:hypothetical protein